MNCSSASKRTHTFIYTATTIAHTNNSPLQFYFANGCLFFFMSHNNNSSTTLASLSSVAAYFSNGFGEIPRHDLFVSLRFPGYGEIAMSRPMALGLLLLVLILTSQSEWKQQSKNEPESTAAVSKQQQISNKREVIKEQEQEQWLLLLLKPRIRGPSFCKIILSQEKKIFILNELVKSLRQQLAQCQEIHAENATEVPSNRRNETGRVEGDV